MKEIKKSLENALLGLLSLMPDRLMSHVLFLLRSRSDITDRWGYHVRSIHYYDPVPDFRRITPEHLSRERVSPAIVFAIAEQQSLMDRLSERFGAEIAQLATNPVSVGFDFSNAYFGGLDAATYYALIRDLKPRLVMEIGCGYSTQIASKALQRNVTAGNPGKLLCIEPYPESRLTESAAHFELIRTRVQDLPLEFFDQLGANDILMIDSSHVGTIGSDVCFEILEILPRLKPGVWIHVHDIFFPADYPAEWVIQRRQAFNEQYLLEAFLAYNSAFSVQLANAWLWRKEYETTKCLFDGPLAVSSPASFWMKRVQQ